MDYAQLVAAKTTANSIKAWLNWDLAPSTDILAEAETYIYDKLRIREMKLIATGTINDGDLTLAMPTYFLAPISFRRIGASAGRITIFDSDQMESRNVIDQDGNFVEAVPTECQIIGDPPVVYFNVESDDDYDYRLVYWGRKAPLSGSNTTNFLTNRYPKMLRTACLMSGYEFYKQPDQEKKYEGRLEKLIFEANSMYDLGEQANRFETYQDEDD